MFKRMVFVSLFILSFLVLPMSYTSAADKNCMNVNDLKAFTTQNSLSPLFVARKDLIKPNLELGYIEFVSPIELIVFSLSNKTGMACKILELQQVTVFLPNTEK